MEFSVYGAFVIFLLSIARAMFWMLIIFSITFAILLTYRSVVTFLTEEIKEKKPKEE